MRKKAVPLKNLVKKLDNVFQMCIRYRDNFTCITCGKKFPRGERTQCHAGHFISRGIYATRWDEENVNCQCAGCNLKQSNADVEVINRYAKELELKYGKGTVDRLFQKKHSVFKLNRGWLEDNIELYTQALKNYEEK
jgi:hypothetical protein